MSTLFLIILKLITLESCEGADVCCRLWNMHYRVLNELPRTNNNLEGWYTRFSTMFRQTHPSNWEFINTLKLDASHNQMLIAQVLAGAAPPPQKRVYRDVNARIATLVQGTTCVNIKICQIGSCRRRCDICSKLTIKNTRTTFMV